MYRRLTFLALAACTTTPVDEADDPSSGGKADDATVRGLPADLAPWGGPDPARWSPEAILANAVTPILQRDPAARVSIATSLLASQHAPFGDGQTNAAATLAHWTGARPPVIGVRSGRRLAITFDRDLPFGGDTFELWTPAGAWVQSVRGDRTPDGGWRIELTDPPAPIAERLVVSPRGWRDGFPLSFALPVAPIAALEHGLAPALRRLPGGEPIVDPVGAAGEAPAATLRASTFPDGFVNQQPFTTGDLHAAFPQGAAPRVTAVGGAATWVATSPFKNLYVCLDRRSLDAEARHGVPSGAGWHHIGDAGESIVASLERTPLIVGHASGTTLAPPAGGAHAYGLAHAATFTVLQPGHAFTTPRGDFHWYAVHHDADPCVQVWVHRCVPDAAAPSIGCPGD